MVFGKNPYRELERRIGYRFRRRMWLKRALVHRSYRFEQEDVDADNQRLEFLGDAILGFLAAAYVYDTHRDEDEGVLTSFRSQTTSGHALAETARRIGLGEFISMGRGEERSGGRDRESNLADALEAIMGAAYVDGGVKGAKKVFETVFVPELEGLSGDVWEGNPKGKLQEYTQRVWKTSPRYRVVRREGPAHDTVFTVEVTLGEGQTATGQGRNKQKAEVDAATNALRAARGRP